MYTKRAFIYMRSLKKSRYPPCNAVIHVSCMLLFPRNNAPTGPSSATDWILNNPSSLTPAVVSKQTLTSLQQRQPCRFYITRDPSLRRSGGHSVDVCLWTFALSNTLKEQSVVAPFYLFSLAVIKVTFISCASAKMATPRSGYTQQLLWKT
jgi:hypothetical protein